MPSTGNCALLPPRFGTAAVVVVGIAVVGTVGIAVVDWVFDRGNAAPVEGGALIDDWTTLCERSVGKKIVVALLPPAYRYYLYVSLSAGFSKWRTELYKNE